MLTRARPGPNDEGETLLELLIAVAIMGIAVVAIVGGIATSILMSDIHRKQATAGAYVRNYAEAVVSYAAVPGNFDATASPDYSPATIDFKDMVADSPDLPAGFDASVTSVRCWQSGSLQFNSCTAGSSVQQVTVNIASSDSRASESLVVVVRKQP